MATNASNVSAANVASRISFGIAGWSYADWEDYVYPRGTKDKLRYIAEFMDMIEVNSTFYRVPDRRMVQSWAARTRDLPGFTFSAKLHQDVTHRGRIDVAGVAAFHDGLAPLVEEGRLKHVLAQFRYDFADSPSAREHLGAVEHAFGDMANMVLELRHNSWQSRDAMQFLGGLGVTVANLDYPTARDSFNLRLCPLGPDAYLRLHGRNRKAWFSKAGRDETYNYNYQGPELDDIADRAVRLAEMSGSLTLVANNHYQGKEAVNILELKAKITGQKVAAPPRLVERYPQLRDVATRLPDLGRELRLEP